MRGVVVGALDSASIAAISTVECWEKVGSLSRSLGNPSEPVSVLCEIWLDTGRVIWVQTDRREFCRVELSLPDLERRYFEISGTESFEHDYDLLITQIRDAIRNGSKQIDLGFAQRIAIRDSDDSTTEEIMN